MSTYISSIRAVIPSARALGALPIFALALGACGGADPEETPTEGVTPTLTASPTATPSETPTPTATATEAPTATDSPTEAPTPTQAPTPTETATPTEAPTPTATPAPVSFTPEGSFVAIVSTVSNDYSMGTLTQIDGGGSYASNTDLRTVSGNTVVHGGNGTLYVFERSFGGADTIRAFDPLTLERLGEVVVDGGANPEDLTFINGKGYVSLYVGDGVLVFDEETFEVLKTIDLTEYADPDGIPNAKTIMIANGTVYVGLQRVDYTGGFAPVTPGYLVEIDPASDTVSQAIALTGSNPTSIYEDGEELVVCSPGSYGVQDGGIERVDVNGGASEGFILTEASLGVDQLGGFVVADGAGWYVQGGAIKGFDLVTGGVVDTPANLGGLTAQGLAVDPNGDLWVANEAGDYDVFDLSLEGAGKLNSTPIDVGDHNPYGLAFISLED